MKRLMFIGLLVLILCGIGLVHARIIPDASPDEQEPQDFAAELETLEVMGDGIVLTLAACEEEPHCVTAVSEEELSRLIDQLEQRIATLETHVDGQGTDPVWHEMLGNYRDLRGRYGSFLGEYEEVLAAVDPDTLEEDWVELLDFGIDEGPQVPEPNERLTLSRFVDNNMPMPLD